MVINCDHYCINCHVSDSEVNYRPMQAKYACSDPSTDAGLEECLSVLLAPNGYTTDYLKLVYEAPAITFNDENRARASIDVQTICCPFFVSPCIQS